mgnify:CR=1 FL=1
MKNLLQKLNIAHPASEESAQRDVEKHEGQRGNSHDSSDEVVKLKERYAVLLDSARGELQKAKKEAERSVEYQFALLSSAGEEIKNALNIIVEFSGLLATSDDRAERETYAGIINENNELLQQLISDLMDIAKVEEGVEKLISAPVDIDDMMRQIVQMNRRDMSGDDVKLVYAGGYGQPFVIKTDQRRLSQIIDNLLSNAIKFTDKGQITLGFKVKGRDTLYIYVKDTGRGIPAENLDSIFDHFNRLDKSVKGTGLGLSVCKTLVNKFGGEIGVDSKLGEGSMFWFTIPYEATDDTSTRIMEPESAPEIQQEADNGDKPKILIAEDDTSNYFLFESILKREYELFHAFNGKEAVEMFPKVKPNVIIMDVKMPVMDGFQATEEIRKIDGNVPIIAATAYALPEVEEKLYKCGANGYIVKPISSAVLKKKLMETMSSRETDNNNQ